MPKGLYVPGQGMVNFEKDITELTVQEVRMLSWLHEWAYKHQVNIFCKRCEQAITGQNNDSPDTKHVEVACGCRTWRFAR